MQTPSRQAIFDFPTEQGLNCFLHAPPPTPRSLHRAEISTVVAHEENERGCMFDHDGCWLID